MAGWPETLKLSDAPQGAIGPGLMLFNR